MDRDIDRLRRWCVRRKMEGWKVSTICRHARIPRATFYFWWSKYRDGGMPNLDSGSRRPKTIHRTRKSIVRRIVELRRETGWNEEGHRCKAGVRGR